jgi:hypothetical protein
MHESDRAKALAWLLADFRRFCGALDIIRKDRRRTKLVLNDIQRAYCSSRSARDIILKCRQIGITTLEQARDLYVWITQPGSRVVVTCQSITDHTPAKLLSTNYNVMIEGLARAGLALRVRQSAGEWILPDRDSSLRIIEAGASEAAAEKKGRAGTITRLHLTETAFYEYADSTLNALLECVPKPEDGSEIVVESTPNGAAGAFYRQCQDALSNRSGYRLHFFPWFQEREYALALDSGEDIKPQNERDRQLIRTHGVSPEQLKWYQRKRAEKLGNQDLMDQEYPSDVATCFLVSGRSFFDRQRTDKLRSEAKPPVLEDTRQGIKMWSHPRAGFRYLIAVDTAEGRSTGAPGDAGDYSAAVIYERETGAHVASLRARIQPWELARRVAELGRHYNRAHVVVERNNHGHAVLQALQREQRYAPIYYGLDGKPGWLTTVASRPVALDGLEDSHRRGAWTSSDLDLLAEMLVFVVTSTGKAEAARGEHDDLIMAAAIGWDVLRRPLAFRNLSNLPPG